MTDIAERIANLSPEKRALLNKKLASTNNGPLNNHIPIARNESAPTPSFGQERLWFLEQIEGGTPLYNISIAIRLVGQLDLAALHSALNAIVRRHDSLRTRYLSDLGTLRLVVDDNVHIDLPVTDLRALPIADHATAVEMALEKEAAQVIVLDRDLMLRAALIRVTNDDQILQLTVHHIASDGWSLGVLYRELSACYNAALTGKSAQLAELPIRYSDFAHWQRQTLQGAELDRLTSYWREQLGAGPFVLDLPTDRPRPVSQTFNGKQRRFELSAATAKAIREFSRLEGATPFMVLLAAFYAVLQRYSGQPTIFVGSPAAARGEADVEGLIGFFVNTLVMRGDLSGEPTFRDLVSRVKRTSLDAYMHQDTPLEKIIERVNPERDLSRSPLFQVMFTMQNTPSEDLVLHGLSATINEVHTGTSKFDLSMSVAERGPTLEVLIDFNTDLFDAATIDILWAHYRTFTENALLRPMDAVAVIPVMTEAERLQVVREWNATALAYPREVPLATLLEAQVARTPEATAVVFGEERVTYGELNARANRLARELVTQGAGPDTLVGLCVERSVAMMVALLAIIKAGAAYLPIDPFLPIDRKRHMIEDSGLAVLITQESVRGALPECAAAVVSLDRTAVAPWDANSAANLAVAVRPEQLGYVIYTSGSTGKPKGVELSRGALLNLLWSMREWLALGETDRVLAVTTISFDIASADVWLPWLVGAETILATREQAADGDALRALIARHAVTFLQATPVTWRLLLGAGWAGKPDLQIVCTGEAMPPELAHQLTPIVGRVWNLYGPTETTIWSTGYRVEPGDETILIGRPVGNTQCYVLDAHLQPVPPGVTGELYIAGDGLARGYLRRPDLTAEKFVANPFEAGRKMYRTGDLARYRADGNLECLGRTDHQVKIRGFRIELGEIESLLLQYPGVQQAVVMAREDTPGEKRLVAYVVSATGPVEGAAVRTYLKASVPEYMVPAAFVTLDRIPLSANGKIDRKALPAPDADQTPAALNAYLAPRTYVEKQLSEIWEETFNISRVSVDADFFDLGGHSLLALKMMAKVTQVFGKRLPLNALFESPSIEALAKHIETDQKKVGQHTLVSIQASGSRPPIYWIPGGAALGMFRLRHIVTRLGPEQPVYGLGSSHPSSLHDVENVEQRASNYLELIRKVQPNGPYCIAGFCAGGRVAYELAQRLTADGEHVAFLAMINCGVPNFPTGQFNNFRIRVQRLRQQIRTARAGGMTWFGYFRSKMKERAEAKLEHEKRAAARNLVQEHGFEHTDSSQNQVLLDATIEKFDQYQPRPYAGPVSLFISDDQSLAGVSKDLDPRFAWSAYALNNEIRVFPGGHEAILEMPYAIEFARVLNAALLDALAAYEKRADRDA